MAISMKVKASIIQSVLHCVLISISIVFFVSCGTNNKSERESLRERNQLKTQTKTKELQQVAGEYHGKFIRSAGTQENITLNLEIKNVPETQDGQVDPILVPTLSGFIRFNFSEAAPNSPPNLPNDSSSEFVSFSVGKGDFDLNTAKMNLVVNNSQYKDIFIYLDVSTNRAVLHGTWSAPSASEQGSLELVRSVSSGGTGKISDHPLHHIKGEYRGLALWDKSNQLQLAKLALSTSVKLPDAINVRATLRLIFGDDNSTEQTTYSYDDVSFNPISGQLTLRQEGLNVSLFGQFVGADMRGHWSNRFMGETGEVIFSVGSSYPLFPLGYEKIQSLAGIYQGKLENTNTQSHLPERVTANFISSEDLSQPDGISITGNMRLYFGAFGSTEYVELPFSRVEFNIYTRRLVAQTAGAYPLTLKGLHAGKNIEGLIFHEGLGEIANLKVAK